MNRKIPKLHGIRDNIMLPLQKLMTWVHSSFDNTVVLIPEIFPPHGLPHTENKIPALYDLIHNKNRVKYNLEDVTILPSTILYKDYQEQIVDTIVGKNMSALERLHLSDDTKLSIYNSSYFAMQGSIPVFSGRIEASSDDLHTDGILYTYRDDKSIQIEKCFPYIQDPRPYEKFVFNNTTNRWEMQTNLIGVHINPLTKQFKSEIINIYTGAVEGSAEDWLKGITIVPISDIDKKGNLVSHPLGNYAVFIRNRSIDKNDRVHSEIYCVYIDTIEQITKRTIRHVIHHNLPIFRFADYDWGGIQQAIVIEKKENGDLEMLLVMHEATQYRYVGKRQAEVIPDASTENLPRGGTMRNPYPEIIHNGPRIYTTILGNIILHQDGHINLTKLNLLATNADLIEENPSLDSLPEHLTSIPHDLHDVHYIGAGIVVQDNETQYLELTAGWRDNSLIAFKVKLDDDIHISPSYAANTHVYFQKKQ